MRKLLLRFPWVASLILGISFFNSPAVYAIETSVISASNSLSPECGLSPKNLDYGIELRSGLNTALVKVEITVTSVNTNDYISIRPYQFGTAYASIGTLAYANSRISGSNFIAVFTGSVLISAASNYMVVLYSNDSGYICHQSGAYTNSNSFSFTNYGYCSPGSDCFHEMSFSNGSGGYGASYPQISIYADVFSGDFSPPVLLTNPNQSVQEGNSNVADLVWNETTTSSLSPGGDSNLFSLINLTPASFRLRFVSAPDFENPSDSNADNIYLVPIQSTDEGGYWAIETVTVTVSNVDEFGRLISYELSAAPQKGKAITVSAVVNVASKVTFYLNDRRISKCIGISTSGTSPIVATCNWKPAIRGSNSLSFTILPTQAGWGIGSSGRFYISVGARTNKR